MPKDLSSLFSPKSIAVIGASRSPEKVGAIILKNIIESGYSGKIFPVNPNADSINGFTAFPNVKNLPEKADVAIIAVPTEIAIQSLKEVGEAGIKNAVVISAGFKETGPEGEKLEQQLIETANQFTINLLGPNCLGFVNNNCSLNATFGQSNNLLGNLRFVSQSGAIATSLFDWTKSSGLGINEFITLGNKANINENDVLSYLSNKSDDSFNNINREGLSINNPIALYLESISNGSEFLKVATSLAKKDPVFIIKPGKSAQAAKAMQSHTGAIAGEDSVLETALKEAGIIRAKTLEDFFDLCKAFSWENVPQGAKVAIISNAGGPAVISADAVISEDLELLEFDDETKKRLEEVLPRAASVMDPVDVMGDALADRYAKAAEIILEKNQANALLIILTPQVMTQIEKTAELIGELSKKYQTPIFCSFIGGGLVGQGIQKLNQVKIPSFNFPERAIFAIGQMWKWQKQNNLSDTIPVEDHVEANREKINEIIQKTKNDNQKNLDNFEANELIQNIGIPTAPTAVAENFDQIKQFVNNYGFPVALKLSSSLLLHKKDIGAVIADISNEALLETAWNNITKKINELDAEIKKDLRIQIQKDIINGVEIIVGVKRDPTFGPVLLFGAGGTLAELILDKNLHLLPQSRQEVKSLIESSKIYKLLKGYRGEPPYAIEKLCDLVFRLGQLIDLIPDAAEIEINPVIVTINDVFAIDTKVVFKQGEVKPVTLPNFKIATTIKHEVLASKYHYFTFQTDEPIQYKPGQYVSVKVADKRINAYSIAGQEGNNFHLLVDSSPGGPGSKFFENLKEGDKLTYLGPFGVFTLKENDNSKHMLFLGTGSGCSPLKCMLEAALKNGNQTPMTLYFGLRFGSDVFWQDYFRGIEQQHPNFKFKLVLSKPDQDWQGYSGHITDVVLKELSDGPECSAYICGNGAMTTQAIEILQSKGVPKERIYTEKF